MRSIAIVNQKGGCGKTTTAVNLSSCIADTGKRVLLIDNDPQSHASMGMGVDTEKLTCSTYDLFMDPAVQIRDAAQPIMDGLDLVPSNVILSAVEQQLAGRPDRENRLRAKIDICENEYDYLIVDCPPSVGLLTFNALVACRESLVVMEPSYFSLHGAFKMIETIRLVRDQLGMRKRVRVLLTLFDRRTKYNKQFVIDAGERFGLGMMNTVVRRTTRFKEAANRGLSILRHDKSCSGAQDYIQLAREILGQETELYIDDFEAVAGIKNRGPAPGTTEWVLSHRGPQVMDRGVLFSLLAPEADMVELVGSFNGWHQENSVLLNRQKNGIWVTTVQLDPGRHLYKFVVDGRWMPDPANEHREAPNEDCIIEVPDKKAAAPAASAEAEKKVEREIEREIEAEKLEKSEKPFVQLEGNA